MINYQSLIKSKKFHKKNFKLHKINNNNLFKILSHSYQGEMQVIKQNIKNQLKL